MAEKLNLQKLAFIGGGAMGEAIIKGITGAGLMDPAAWEHTGRNARIICTKRMA